MIQILISVLLFVWAYQLLKRSPVEYHEVDRIRERKEPVQFTDDFTNWWNEIHEMRNAKNR